MTDEATSPEDGAALLYLYGVVPAGTKVSKDLRGIDDRPVRTVEAGSIRALVSEVDAHEYGASHLDERLGDLEWVGDRAARHERVLLHVLSRAPVVPTGVFSLHADAEALAHRLREREDGLGRALERVAGRAEWTVRLWLYPERVEEVLEAYSPEAAALASEVDRAGPGQRYLMKRKRTALLDRGIEAARRREVDAVLERLAPLAAGVAPVATPARGPAGGRRLIGQVALLLDPDAAEAVAAEADRLRSRWRADEIEIERTGPWPPYHFVEGGEDE